MARTAPLLLLLASLLLLGAPPAAASVVLQYDFEQLVAEADSIVHARVVEQQADWREQTIVTRVVLEVVACPKGDYAPGDRIAIEQAGGVVGDLAMIVPGEASFATGEEVVVFLEENVDAGAPVVLGMSQGKFTIQADPVDGVLRATRQLEGIALVSPDGSLREVELGRPLPTAIAPSAEIRRQILDGGPVSIPLDAFLAEIHRSLTVVESY